MIQNIQIKDTQLSANVTIEQSYDRYLAYILANFSLYAYENADTLETIYSESIWKFNKNNFFENTYTSSKGFLVSQKSKNVNNLLSVNNIFLTFRGSASVSNIVFPYSDGWINWLQTNGRTLLDNLVPWSKSTPNITVASGFKAAWESIKGDVIDRINSARSELGSADRVNLVITGHSLGAALATLATVELHDMFKDINIVTYTYATPVVGNRGFAQMYNKLMEKSSNNPNPIKSEHFLIKTDPIRLVGYLYGCAKDNNSGQCYAKVKNQNILPFPWAINHHSIHNYIDLLTPYPSTRIPTETKIESLQNIISQNSNSLPSQSNSFFSQTPNTKIVIRTYTVKGFDNTDSSQNKVYFYFDVAENGTGGKRFLLAKSNHSSPFQSGYVDTFELVSQDNLTFADFTRCKIVKSKNTSSNDTWVLQGLQILLDGRELFNNSSIFTQFDNQNRVFYFSGIAPNKVAVGIDWKYQDGISYDKSGADPVCSIDSFGNIVEVHKGAHSNKLYYRCGKMNDNGSITWDESSHEYDTSGVTPWVAINDDRVVVEVHKGASSDKFYYRVGYLRDGFRIDWEDSRQYDTSGLNPSVAIRGNQIVEVHKGANSNKLYYRLGELNVNAKRVKWGDSNNYDSSGKNPSVAITNDLRVVEVHKGANSNKLYYRVGHIFNRPFIFDAMIHWDVKSHEYDTSGEKPTVAVDSYGKVLEVHKGANSDKLYYRVGTMGNDFTVVWASSSQEYDSSGEAPVIATNDNGQVVEVHKGAHSDKLYYRAGKWVKDPFNIL